MQLEAYLQRDDRIVLPIGSTEQHAYLSLATDSILAERVAVEAAEPLGVPVLPVLVRDHSSLRRLSREPQPPSSDVRRGPRRSPRLALRAGLPADHAPERARRKRTGRCSGGPVDRRLCRRAGPLPQSFGPETYGVIRDIEPHGQHASWWENFPWTRLEGVSAPAEAKPPLDDDALREGDPRAFRELAGDGSFGGPYERPQEDLDRVWQSAIAEARERLENGWN